jgi:AcrR family transcriptional regulator
MAVRVSTKKKTIVRTGRPVDQNLRSRRREEILSASAKIFAELGYSKTDLQKVADILRIGKGTIYRYFPTKQILFLSTVDLGMKRLLETINRETEQIKDPIDRITRGMYTYLKFFDKHPEFAELIIQERAEFKNRKKPTYFEYREEALNHWRGVITGLIGKNRFRRIDFEVISDIIGNLLYGVMFNNFFTGKKKSYKSQVHDICNILYFGLFTEHERKHKKSVNNRNKVKP